MAVGILDLSGEVIVASNAQRICSEFHLGHPETRQRCILANPELTRGLCPDNGYQLFRCGNGLEYAIAKIDVAGQHVGNGVIGQFFAAASDPELFRSQATRYGFDPAAYMAALSSVPVLTEERVEAALSYVVVLAELLGEMGLSAAKWARLLASHEEAEATLGRLQQAIETAADSFFSMSSDGCFTYANRAAARSLGCPQDELIGKAPWDISPVFSSEDWPVHWQELRRKGTLCIESRHATADGRSFPVEIITNHVVLDDGEYEFAHVRDITERKRSEQRLQHTLKRLRLTVDAAVKTLARTVEMRDPYTAGHQERVTRLAVAIGARLGLRQRQLTALRIAALIHDLGKIAIPVEILSKPGTLSDCEWTLLQQHPTIGHEILKEMRFPGPVASIVRDHHERLDGSGYPSGIAGEAMSIEARIVAVADVVEAMASHRPYRAALGIEVALRFVTEHAGSLFDERVVTACLQLFREDGFTFD